MDSPTLHPTVSSTAEGARRRLARPVRPKEPLSLETVVRVAQSYNSVSASLADVRFLFVLLVGYDGLFRISELLNVRVKDVSISDVGMSLFVVQRKNDQFREGHTSLIARSSKTSCPVAITERILSLLPGTKDSCFPVVRRIVSTKKGAHFHKSLGITYATIREEFRKYVSPFVDDYCLHSLSQVAPRTWAISSVIPELKDKHAGWKNPCTKRRYTKHSQAEMLEVTKSMGI